MVIVIHSELEALLRTFYKEIFSLKEDNGLEIYPIFNTLPDRKLYTDYYEVITSPISLNTLKKRVPHYTEAQDFLNDAVQMSWNAKTYNTKESEVHKYAKILDKYLLNDMFPRLQKEYPLVRYPYLGPLPDVDDEKEQIEIRDKQRQEDEKNGIKPEDLMKLKPSPIDEKPESTSNNKRVMRSNTTMEERKLVVEPENEQDWDYSQSTSSTRFRTNQIPFNRSLSTDTHEPTPDFHTTSLTPQTVPKTFNKTTSARKNIRRGRPPVIDLPYLQRIKNILKNLKRETDNRNHAITTIFDNLPEEFLHGRYQSIIPNPRCLNDMKKKARNRTYKDFQSFQNDFNLMLTNYKIFYNNDPENLDIISSMAKVFAILAKNELSRPDKYYLPEGELRYPLDDIVVNNVKFVTGDWVLLKNPNDETKPIIGQIFKLWKTPNGEQWLNACWYFRPEQTVHRVDRLFYKNEVMKTGQYRDHLIEDIVSECYVIHFTRFQRGNPEKRVGGPLFVCEYRYNESDKVFNKIRTWKACLPEELRDVDEPTVPVNGRKFFKYPSPLRHLLAKDATINSRIPQPVQGLSNAPPLIGAVYLRPKVDRDDLGEYSSSTDCPRYIIRPGDPPEVGNIDFETGTIVTDSMTSNILPRPINSQPGLSSLRPTRSSSRLNSNRDTSGMPDNFRMITELNNVLPLVGITQEPLTAQRLAQLQVQRHLARQRMLQKRNETSNHNLATAVNDVSFQVSKSSLTPINVDYPSSFVLPVSITKNVNVLQRTDHSNYNRNFIEDNQPVISKKRYRGEILWFRGPSVDISERYVNFGNDYMCTPLNKMFKKDNLQYSEVNEIVDKKNRILSRHQQANIIEKYDLDNDTQREEQHSNHEDDNNLHEFDNESRVIPSTFVLGLRPSGKFMAYKLGTNEVI